MSVAFVGRLPAYSGLDVAKGMRDGQDDPNTGAANVSASWSASSAASLE
jgi:hypothetical protein